MPEMRNVGSIAFYPGMTHCALTTISGDQGAQFDEPVTKELFESQSPEEAFEKARKFFGGGHLDALCITMYGIVDNKNRQFLGGPQEGWTKELDITEYCRQYLEPDISVNNLICSNDSAAGAVAEYVWGAGCEIDKNGPGRADIVYFGILDGIGSGVIQDGQLWDGFAQPEMGHLPVRRYIDTIKRRSGRDPFPGICPYHHDCVEGLASQFALAERMKPYSIETLEDLIKQENHELWDVQAYYLAELAVAAGMVVFPRRIVFGGPMIHSALIPRIRAHFEQQVDKYPSYLKEINSEYISASVFHGINAPLFGGLELARQSLLTGAKSEFPGIDGRKFQVAKVKSSPFFQSIFEANTSNVAFPQKTKKARDPDLHLKKISLGKPSVEKKTVFGLSITETIQWGIAEAIDGHLVGDIIEKGDLGGIPGSTVPFGREAPIYIQREIEKALRRLPADIRKLLEDVDGVGVSSIGVINPESKKLVSIARKNWVPDSYGCLIDFGDLFLSSELFPKIRKNQIEVQNDAPARCLTEYYHGANSEVAGDGRPIRSLMYLMVGEGVNGAIVHDGELPHMIGHPEMGHQLPLPHILDLLEQSDRNPVPFDERRHTGCPKHLRCFEGVASRARIRAQWGGKELWELPADHIAWEIEAYYLCQLAMNAVLTHNPDIILFGGQMFTKFSRSFPGFNLGKGTPLIERVRSNFLKQNAGYLPQYASADNVKHLIVPASMGEEIKVSSALVMACIGAFSSDRATWERSARGNRANIDSSNVIPFDPNSGRKK